MQLFSTPQHTQARRTSSEPDEKLSAPSPSRLSSAHDAVTTAMPAQVRDCTGSWKATNATSAVATISKLLSSDTFSGAALARPAMSRMGAATSRRTMARTKGASERRRRSSPEGACPAAARAATSAAIPAPAPR